MMLLTLKERTRKEAEAHAKLCLCLCIRRVVADEWQLVNYKLPKINLSVVQFPHWMTFYYKLGFAHNSQPE